MKLDEKILGEIERYKSINNYILEQEAPPEELGAMPPPEGGVENVPPPPAEEPPPASFDTSIEDKPEVIDVKSDPDVEKIDDEGKSEEKEEKEELDVTDLVDSQKNIESKQEEYFNNLFSQLSNLESKLSEMDSIMNKLNSLETKIEKYRDKTPEEKLELRSYDSYPFNQKLSDFFDDKKEEMKLTGKNDYVLTSDQVTDINVADIKNSFQPGGDLDQFGSKFK